MRRQRSSILKTKHERASDRISIKTKKNNFHLHHLSLIIGYFITARMDIGHPHGLEKEKEQVRQTF